MAGALTCSDPNPPPHGHGRHCGTPWRCRSAGERREPGTAVIASTRRAVTTGMSGEAQPRDEETPDGLVTLWRPVGPGELELIAASGYRAFPPRLPEQPIFYPVLTDE